MANHFKRARKGDVVLSRRTLKSLVRDVAPLTRGVITGVETPGQVFRVKFGSYSRVTAREDLWLIFRPNGAGITEGA